MVVLYLYFFYMILFGIFLFLISLKFLIDKLVIFLEFNLIKFNSIELELLILLDWMSLMFISIVLVISSMVIFYSMEYMKLDLNIKRFMYLILLFVFSMLLMILSPNMLSILLGWDGLGLISYCLVIYYQNITSFNSGMVTVLTNRIGDIMILMMISLLMSLGSLNFMFFIDINLLLLFIVFIAAFTKSAQFPFSSWLPLAMAAPTPVSSLVHSSTLVTAGVYLMIRFNYLMIDNLLMMNLMMILSVITMLLSGLGASIEFDLKKIIALSTLSQLGLMMFGLSFGLIEVVFFHLLMHALFKSMLFMCVGVIIHNMFNNQDIRYISMILYNMPIVSMLFNCSFLSLGGFPFLSGFFSKDMILELYLMDLKMNYLIFMILFISMGLTVFYSIRLIYYSFLKVPVLSVNFKLDMMYMYMINSMLMLFFLSIMGGVSLSWILFSMKNLIILTYEMKLLIYLFMFLGLIMGGISHKIKLKNELIFNINCLYMYFSCMWFMPMIYGMGINCVMKFNNKLIYSIELGWGEYIWGVNLISFIKSFLSMDLVTKNFFYLLIMYMYMILAIMLN